MLCISRKATAPSFKTGKSLATLMWPSLIRMAQSFCVECLRALTWKACCRSTMKHLLQTVNKKNLHALMVTKWFTTTRISRTVEVKKVSPVTVAMETSTAKTDTGIAVSVTTISVLLASQRERMALS